MDEIRRRVLLENDINQYDKITFLKVENIVSAFIQLKADKNSSYKLLVLTEKQKNLDIENIIFRQIAEEEGEHIERLYSMYEFSDKFLLVSEENMNYPNLFDLINTGMLSMEEILESLFGK